MQTQIDVKRQRQADRKESQRKFYKPRNHPQFILISALPLVKKKTKKKTRENVLEINFVDSRHEGMV